MIFLIGIGKRLKDIRKKNNLTINDLAFKANVSNGLVSRIENGRTIPSLPVLLDLIQSLEIDASYFFEGVEKKSNAKFIFVPKESQQVIEKEVEAEGFKYMHIFSKILHSLGFEAALLTLEPNSKREKVITDAWEFKYILNLAASYKDIRIWKSALPATVIANWAHQDITSSHPYYFQLLANWKCNETSGSSLTDSSPNANNMIITGSPAFNPNTTANFKIYDYTSTTRETDHFPTVLNWLCIPVSSSWGIDGVNRIPECSNGSLTTKEIKEKTDDFKVYPNPASSSISIIYHFEDKIIKSEIIDAKGALVSTKNLQSSTGYFEEKMNIESLPAGIYFIKLNGSKKSMTKAFIKK